MLLTKVSTIKVFLLTRVIMFSTDRAKVSDISKVSKLQDHHRTMLHRCLKIKFVRDQEAEEKLQKGIEIFAMAKEAQDIRSQMLSFYRLQLTNSLVQTTTFFKNFLKVRIFVRITKIPIKGYTS